MSVVKIRKNQRGVDAQRKRFAKDFNQEEENARRLACSQEFVDGNSIPDLVAKFNVCPTTIYKWARDYCLKNNIDYTDVINNRTKVVAIGGKDELLVK